MKNSRKKLLLIIFLFSFFIILPIRLYAKTLLVYDYAGTYTYGHSYCSNFNAVIQTAFGGAENITSVESLEGVTLTDYDALFIDRRWTSSTLSSEEKTQIQDFIATGKRVFMAGENDNFLTWDNSMLSVVGGSYGSYVGSNPYDLNVSYVGHSLVNSVTTINSQWSSANGGTSLFTENVSTLWGEDENVLTHLDFSMFCNNEWGGDWSDEDNAQFAENIGNWLAADTDSTNPSVSDYFPADDSTGVTTTAKLILTFDETVDVETGNITIYDSGDNLFEQIPVTATTNVSGSGSATIEITPTSTFTESTGYYVQIDATAFDDTSGNSYAGISDSTTWSFTTGDFTNPTATLSPTDNLTGVTTTANLVLTFNEAVDVETGNITIYDSTDTVFEAIPVTASTNISGSGTATIEINPTSTLSYETSYYIQIDATAFDDTSGNSYAGISDTTTWSFTTEDTPICPTVENAATYNAYPTCGVATCDDGYNLVDGVCVKIGGAAPPPPPAVGVGANSATIGMGQVGSVGHIDSKGVNVLNYINSKVNFITKVSTTKSTQQHSFGVSNLNLENKIVTLTFQSEPTTVTLALGETKQIDLDGDGINDIEATFSDLVVNRVEITTKNLLEDIQEEIESYSGTQVSILGSFDSDLKLGSSGDDVKRLQEYLNSLGYTIAEVGPGSKGNETNYFGSLTQTALAKFQADNNIPAFGFFGPITREFINTTSGTSEISDISGEEIEFSDIKAGLLIKNKKYPEVFYVNDDMTLSWIVDENAALKHFGDTWNQLIKEFEDLGSASLKFGNNLE